MTARIAAATTPLERRTRLAACVLNADLLALELRALEPLERLLRVRRIELHEREPLQDADRPDCVLRDHGPLRQRPADVLVVDAAALAAVDEQFYAGRITVAAR